MSNTLNKSVGIYIHNLKYLRCVSVLEIFWNRMLLTKKITFLETNQSACKQKLETSISRKEHHARIGMHHGPRCPGT